MNRYREGFSEREELILWAMAAGFMAANPDLGALEALAMAAEAYAEVSDELDGGTKIPLPGGGRWLQRACFESPEMLGITDEPPDED